VASVVHHHSIRWLYPLGSELTALQILLEADCLTPELLGGDQRRAEPTERVEDPVAPCRNVLMTCSASATGNRK
jgi:hypothetical protein